MTAEKYLSVLDSEPPYAIHSWSYDTHGNMMADVSRSGSGFSINGKRSYDAWGNIRSGATSGDPKGRYCANLGHVEDDESNLIYMRARYYDPTSGRFLSEDHSRCGENWFIYTDNEPVKLADCDGKDPSMVDMFIAGLLVGLFVDGLVKIFMDPARFFQFTPEDMVSTILGAYIGATSPALALPGEVSKIRSSLTDLVEKTFKELDSWILQAAGYSEDSVAIAVVSAYTGEVLGLLIDIDQGD